MQMIQQIVVQTIIQILPQLLQQMLPQMMQQMMMSQQQPGPEMMPPDGALAAGLSQPPPGAMGPPMA